MIKKMCVWFFSAAFGLVLVSANADLVMLGGNGNGVKVKIVGASAINASVSAAFANKERVQVVLLLPSNTSDTTLQANCGYNMFGSPLGNFIVAVKPWYPLVPRGSVSLVSQADQLKQTKYNNILSLASSAALSQVDVWTLVDNTTCEIDAFALSP